MILSSGDITTSYSTLGLVYGSQTTEGDFDYEGAVAQMQAVARKESADAILHIGFNERSAIGSKQVCFSNEAVTLFEVRCWGTMVKTDR